MVASSGVGMVKPMARLGRIFENPGATRGVETYGVMASDAIDWMNCAEQLRRKAVAAANIYRYNSEVMSLMLGLGLDRRCVERDFGVYYQAIRITKEVVDSNKTYHLHFRQGDSEMIYGYQEPLNSILSLHVFKRFDRLFFSKFNERRYDEVVLTGHKQDWFEPNHEEWSTRKLPLAKASERLKRNIEEYCQNGVKKLRAKLKRK